MQKLAILHLSDIHFKEGRNLISARVDNIANVAGSFAHDVPNLLIVISGDIAFSGSQKEYVTAKSFMQELEKKLLGTGLKLHSHWVFVPGNHDCNLEENNRVRDMFLSNTKKHRELLDAEVLSACLKVQTNYRVFLKELGHDDGMGESGPLFSSTVLNVEDRKIVLNRCNTAWLSKVPEPQGSIFIPPETVLVKAEIEADLCLTVFHHPFNWFEADNSRDFRRRIEEVSDIILTGHEHDGSLFRRETTDSEPNDYVEGHVLQDSNAKIPSGFNFLVLDFPSRSFESYAYRWKKDFYVPIGKPATVKFSNHIRRLTGAIDPARDLVEFLNDTGARYSHPRVGYVNLEQVFVAPDFREVSDTESPKIAHNSLVEGKEVFNASSREERLLITGPEKSGRTCIGKRICARLIREGKIALFVSASREAKFLKDHGIDRLLQRLTNDQYQNQPWEAFIQLPRDCRALILDDFHLANLNRKGKAELLSRLSSQFGRLIVLGDESLRLEDIASRSRDGAIFHGLKWTPCIGQGIG